MFDSDDLDRQLDCALATYGDPGPGSRLAAQVLTRIAHERAAARRRVQWLWGAGLSAAAACLLLFAVARLHRPPHATPAIESPAPRALIATAQPRAAQPVLQAARRTKKPDTAPATHSAAPRSAIFPTPSPLSHEEQAMIRLLQELPPDQRTQLLEAQQQSAAPLQFASISIPPIEPPAEGKE